LIAGELGCLEAGPIGSTPQTEQLAQTINALLKGVREDQAKKPEAIQN